MTPTAEQLEIRGLARGFASGEIRPQVEAWDAARSLPDAIFGKLAELGFLGMRAPAAEGGLELDHASWLLALEALAWGDASVACCVAVHGGPVTGALTDHGSEEQRSRWLAPMAAGELTATCALPDCGPEDGALEFPLEATRTGTGFRIEGREPAVVAAGRADLLMVFAGVEGGPGGSGGTTCFLLPAEAEGVRVLAGDRTLGLAAAGIAAVEFSGVGVGAEHRLGAEGDGEAIARAALDASRLGIAALATGIAQAAWEHALRYALEREQFGAPLARFGAIQEKLAGMAVRTAQARSLLLDVAGRAEDAAAPPIVSPGSPAAGAAMAKLAASEAAMWVSDEAVQVFGGYGYMRDYPVEKLMRDAKGTEILGGTNEILRSLVAREAVREVEGEG